MAKTKGQIVQSIINEFRPEPYVQKIKCELKPHEDGKVILIVEFIINRKKLEGSSLDKDKVLSWTKELARKIKSTAKVPVEYSQTQIKYN